MKRAGTEANLTGKGKRSESPPPQAPSKGRPTSPRDSSKLKLSKGQTCDALGSSNSEPVSPLPSPKSEVSRLEAYTASAAQAIAAYKDGGPIFSSSEGIALDEVVKAKRGGGSSRHHGGEGGSTRLEREHKELVKAFSAKCEELRASHASRNGVELLLAQVYATGAEPLARQRLEAAEATAKAAAAELRAERQRHGARACPRAHSPPRASASFRELPQE